MTKRKPQLPADFGVPARPSAIDPAGCGCTECLTGEYVPYDRATDAQILDMLRGYLACHLNEGMEIRVVRTYVIGENRHVREDAVQR